MSNVGIYERVRDVIDADIRPSLKIHGGDVSLLDITDDGCVQLEFEGACRGCALQSVTYAVGVRQRLLEDMQSESAAIGHRQATGSIGARTSRSDVSPIGLCFVS